MAEQDRWWRSRLESLRRAGFEYIPIDRFETRRSPEPSFSGDADSAMGELEPQTEQPPDQFAVDHGSLKILQEQVAGCTRCPELAATRTQTVFADGSAEAELCFVGEAPGFDEDRTGVPFVGRAGELLTRMILGCKLERSEVYICNTLKCRPPDNRDPTPMEASNCRGYLDRQLQLVQPKVIVALGKHAAAALMETNVESVKITKIRGIWQDYRGIPLMPTLHPSYLLRNPAAKRDVWEDLKLVMERLGRPVK